jgi:hypothetical protein
MRTTRWLIALVTVMSTAFLTATSAFAGTGPTQGSKDAAGYQVTGRWFRYVSTTVALPTTALCKQMAVASPQGFGAAITLGNFEESVSGVPSTAGPAATLGVSMVPSSTGCGLISPSFAANFGTAPQFAAGAITLHPGDTVRLDLYYSQANQSTTATIYNLTLGTKAQSSFPAGATYTSASVTGGFGAFTAPSSQFRVWAFTSSLATTYTGVRGTLTGPWATGKVVMTPSGGSADTALASPSFLWNSGANFGVWAR